MKRSAIDLSPYLSSHPQLSPSSLTHPQPSTHPLPHPPMSQQSSSSTLGSVTQRHGPSTSATSLPPPEKRRRGEPSPCEDIARTPRALHSYPRPPSGRGRPGRRGRRNPETKALKLQEYVDSGGPHRAGMVIDNLTSEYC